MSRKEELKVLIEINQFVPKRAPQIEDLQSAWQKEQQWHKNTYIGLLVSSFQLRLVHVGDFTVRYGHVGDCKVSEWK